MGSTALVPVPADIPAAQRRLLESLRNELIRVGGIVDEQAATITSMEKLLGGTSADQARQTASGIPPVSGYGVEVFPSYVVFYITKNPASYFVELWRGVGSGASSTTAQLVSTTDRTAIEDHPPAGESYRYWLRFVDSQGAEGPFSPAEGIPFTSQPLADPESGATGVDGLLFLETFEDEDLIDWSLMSGGSATITYPLAGVVGGKVARIAGAEEWRVAPQIFPFEPNQIYRMKVGVRLSTFPGNGPTSTRALLRAGFMCLDAAGSVLDTAGGANTLLSHFFCAFDKDLGSVSVGTYQEFTGYVRGLGATPANNASDVRAPSVLRTGTKYFRPMIAVNRTGGDGTTEIDYIRIDVLEPQDLPPVLYDVVNVGTATVGNSIRKTATTTAWDSSTYSTQGYFRGAYLTWRAGQTDKAVMMGLNTDPTTNSDYASIDFAVYMRADGIIEIYEGGVSKSTHGGYNSSIAFAMRYDGMNLRYFYGSTLLRTVVAGAGLHLFMDSSFYTPDAFVKDAVFGPEGQVVDVDTAQISPNAATAVFQGTGIGAGSPVGFAGLSAYERSGIGGLNISQALASVPKVDCDVLYTVTFRAYLSTSTGGTVKVQLGYSDDSGAIPVIGDYTRAGVEAIITTTEQVLTMQHRFSHLGIHSDPGGTRFMSAEILKFATVAGNQITFNDWVFKVEYIKR